MASYTYVIVLLVALFALVFAQEVTREKKQIYNVIPTAYSVGTYPYPYASYSAYGAGVYPYAAALPASYYY